MPVNTFIPTYFEYSVMSDYGYLDADEVGKQSLVSKLDEGWEIRECPEGQLDSGYVGAIFVHEARKQIVIAHAGTLPTRVKTFLADARGVVGAGADPLLLDALMRTHGKKQIILKQLVGKEGYRLSFTGHSLGGFLAEMSVYACHRGFGLHYPEASAVVFDSPGSLEVMQAWESHIGQHQINLKQLNIIAFLSSPNLVNTANSHPGTVYRLLRDIPLSTFQSYLLASHDRKKMFALFNPETGFPEENSWVEMEDWPLADYEELLSLKDRPISGALDLAVIKPVQFISGLAQNVWGFLARSSNKISPTRLFGGKEPRKLWELLTSKSPQNYHLLFDVSTREGLSDAIETHYVVKNNAPASLMQRLPLVNISPLCLAFLEFHELYQDRPFYKKYVINSAFNAEIASFPSFHVTYEKGYLYLTEAAEESNIILPGQAGNLQDLLNALEAMRVREGGAAILRRWGQDYIAYLEFVMVKIKKTVAINEAELAGQKQRFSDKSAVLNDLQAELAMSQSQLAQLSKELEEVKALQEQQMALANKGEQHPDFTQDVKIEDSEIKEIDAGIGNVENLLPEQLSEMLDYNRDMYKDRKLDNKVTAKKVKSDKLTTQLLGIKMSSNAAPVKLVENPPSQAQSFDQSGNQPSFFLKIKGVQTYEEGGLFHVRLDYGRLKLTPIHRQKLQALLKDDRYGVGAYGYKNSVVENDEEALIVQLDFSNKSTAEALVEKLNKKLIEFKKPASVSISVVSSSPQENITHPKQ